MARKRKQAPLVLVIVLTTLAFAVFVFWARAQVSADYRVFTVTKSSPVEPSTISSAPSSGLESGLVPRVHASPSHTGQKKISYPGIYVNKGPIEPKPLPKLETLPIYPVDPLTAFDFRRQLEDIGLYLLAGIKMSDPAIHAGLNKVPPQLSTIARTAPKISGSVYIRTLVSKSGALEICLKGTSEKSGTWYYFVPEAIFALYDPVRCP